MLRKLLVLLLVLFVFTNYSHACVGKTIYIGYVDSKEEELVSNVLSRLITERTGTSIKLKKFSNIQSLLQASASGDIDLFVFDSNEVKEISKITDFQKAKTEFNTKYNLVFLKPLMESKNDYKVPIIRKDTLKKFPALPKLIEKLNGLFNEFTISELVNQADKRGIKEAVKDFLKSKNLI